MNKKNPPPLMKKPFTQDRDKDGIPDSKELVQGLDPRYRDTDRDGIEDLKEKRQNSNPRHRQNSNYIDLTRQEFRDHYSRILCQLHGWQETPDCWSIFCQDLQQMGTKLKEIYGRNWDINVAQSALKENFAPEEICYILSQSPYLKTTPSLNLDQKQDYSTTIVSELVTKGQTVYKHTETFLREADLEIEENFDDDDDFFNFI